MLVTHNQPDALLLATTLSPDTEEEECNSDFCGRHLVCKESVHVNTNQYHDSYRKLNIIICLANIIKSYSVSKGINYIVQ